MNTSYLWKEPTMQQHYEYDQIIMKLAHQNMHGICDKFKAGTKRSLTCKLSNED